MRDPHPRPLSQGRGETFADLISHPPAPVSSQEAGAGRAGVAILRPMKTFKFILRRFLVWLAAIIAANIVWEGFIGSSIGPSWLFELGILAILVWSVIKIGRAHV